MRKLVLTVVAGLLLLPPVSSGAETKFGLKVGMNSANLSGADVALVESDLDMPLKSKIGFCGGGFIAFNFSETMAIQVEALYTQKGAKASSTFDGGTVNVYWNADYIEIPVLFKYTFKTGGSMKPALFAGPALAFKMSAKLKVTYTGGEEQEDLDEVKSTDFGLVFGGGLDIGPRIRVDLRYSMGLTKLWEDNGESLDIKNGAFSLMVGYAF